jgi:acetyl-CoA carboxylase alpha subunit
MAAILKDTITRNLDELCALPMNELLQARYQRYRTIGETSHALAPAAGVS